MKTTLYKHFVDVHDFYELKKWGINKQILLQGNLSDPRQTNGKVVDVKKGIKPVSYVKVEAKSVKHPKKPSAAQ